MVWDAGIWGTVLVSSTGPCTAFSRGGSSVCPGSLQGSVGEHEKKGLLGCQLVIPHLWNLLPWDTHLALALMSSMSGQDGAILVNVKLRFFFSACCRYFNYKGFYILSLWIMFYIVVSRFGFIMLSDERQSINWLKKESENVFIYSIWNHLGSFANLYALL